MELVGIGTDVVELDRFDKFDYDRKSTFSIFTKKEVDECKKKQDVRGSLAARFAAKEAVVKCIPELVRLNKIEITTDRTGQPKVSFLESKFEKKYLIHLSMSHARSVATATCIAFIK